MKIPDFLPGNFGEDFLTPEDLDRYKTIDDKIREVHGLPSTLEKHVQGVNHLEETTARIHEVDGDPETLDQQIGISSPPEKHPPVFWSFLRDLYSRKPWRLASDVPLVGLYVFLGADAPYCVANLLGSDLSPAVLLPPSLFIVFGNLCGAYDVIEYREKNNCNSLRAVRAMLKRE